METLLIEGHLSSFDVLSEMAILKSKLQGNVQDLYKQMLQYFQKLMHKSLSNTALATQGHVLYSKSAALQRYLYWLLDLISLPIYQNTAFTEMENYKRS